MLILFGAYQRHYNDLKGIHENDHHQLNVTCNVIPLRRKNWSANPAILGISSSSPSKLRKCQHIQPPASKRLLAYDNDSVVNTYSRCWSLMWCMWSWQWRQMSMILLCMIMVMMVMKLIMPPPPPCARGSPPWRAGGRSGVPERLGNKRRRWFIMMTIVMMMAMITMMEDDGLFFNKKRRTNTQQ